MDCPKCHRQMDYLHQLKQHECYYCDFTLHDHLKEKTASGSKVPCSVGLCANIERDIKDVFYPILVSKMVSPMECKELADEAMKKIKCLIEENMS